MMPNNPNPVFSFFFLAGPEIILILAGIVSICGASNKRLDKRSFGGCFSNLVAFVGCFLSLLLAVSYDCVLRMEPASWLGTISYAAGPGIHLDETVLAMKMVALFLGGLTILLLRELSFMRHQGLFSGVLLLSLAGLLFLCSANNLPTVFFSLELAGVLICGLTMLKKADIRIAGVRGRYVLFGGISTLLLFAGFVIIYKLTGTWYFREIALAFSETHQGVLAIMAVTMVVAGFGVKLAAVPFHFWVPGVYGKSSPSLGAYVASVLPLTVFFLFGVLFTSAFIPVSNAEEIVPLPSGKLVVTWKLIITCTAFLSMVYGAIGTLLQTSVRRLLGDSAIAHTGYMLVIVTLAEPWGWDRESPYLGLEPLIYYCVVYALAMWGLFAITTVVIRLRGSDSILSFAQLRRRMPLVGYAFLVLMLTLGVLPLYTTYCLEVEVSAVVWGIALITNILLIFRYIFVLKVAEGRGPIEGRFLPWNEGRPYITTLVAIVFVTGAILFALCFPGRVIQFFLPMA